MKDEGTSPPGLINLLPSVDLPVQRCKNCSPCFFVGTSLRIVTNHGSTIFWSVIHDTIMNGT